MSIELNREIMFEFDGDKKVGHMKAEFGRKKLNANKWISTDKLKGTSKKLLLEIQDACNDIIFEQVKDGHDVGELCENPTHPSTGETDYFFQTEHYNYWVRFNPIDWGTGLVYVYVYEK